MKKILLIEDKLKRQKLFINEAKIDLTEYEDILDNFIGPTYDELVLQLLADSFSFEKYCIVISHKSAFEKNKNEVINLLKHHCHNHNIPLILFSGGISNNYYDSSSVELLELNSKTFYSKNLKLFLESYRRQEHNILMLCYGQRWEANVCCNILEKLNLFLYENEDEFIEYSELVNATDLKLLDQVHYRFHHMNIENGYISVADVIELQTSIQNYFSNYTLLDIEKIETQSKNLLIHNNNVYSLADFDLRVKFKPPHDDIERYITESIIPELLEKDFDKIFIKDKLTTHYLELTGIHLAYHIRLSQQLGDKRLVPIVILSDFDAQTLLRLDPIAQILFTKNIFISQNYKEAVDSYRSLQLPNLSSAEYTTQFLNLIKVEQPKDTSGSHGIANKWSIYKWADALDVKSEALKKNQEDIENKIYFKYLKAQYEERNTKKKPIKPIKPTKQGNVLLIDDEWDKGWSDILQKALTKDGLVFTPLKANYKNIEHLGAYTYKRIENENPDVVILDLRLLQNDHNDNDDIDSYTGIKILEEIHKINAGIQVVMLTATSKSTILEKLYEKKILGYIKKEHPNDKSIDTVENINKFISLIDKGLGRKYLKEIWDIQKEILQLNILQVVLSFTMTDKEKKLLELKYTLSRTFETLDSNIPKPFIYGMLTLYKCIEIICDYYIYENHDKQKKKYKAYWIETNREIDNYGNASVNNKIKSILKLLNMQDPDLDDLIDQISCTRNYEIHPGEVKPECKNKVVKIISDTHIVDWFYMLKTILEKMNSLGA